MTPTQPFNAKEALSKIRDTSSSFIFHALQKPPIKKYSAQIKSLFIEGGSVDEIKQWLITECRSHITHKNIELFLKKHFGDAIKLNYAKRNQTSEKH